MYRLRTSSMFFTDARIKLISELLLGTHYELHVYCSIH